MEGIRVLNDSFVAYSVHAVREQGTTRAFLDAEADAWRRVRGYHRRIVQQLDGINVARWAAYNDLLEYVAERWTELAEE